MLASHNHDLYYDTDNTSHSGQPNGIDYIRNAYADEISHDTCVYTGSNGTHNHSFSGSSSHTHNITLNLKYINVIVCSKD